MLATIWWAVGRKCDCGIMTFRSLFKSWIEGESHFGAAGSKVC